MPIIDLCVLLRGFALPTDHASGTRVKKGGHDVPEATIRRRYNRSIRNLFELYIPVVTGWKVYDNSATGWPRLLARGARDQPEVVIDSASWALVRGSAANGRRTHTIHCRDNRRRRTHDRSHP